jgi:hypothetical protein
MYPFAPAPSVTVVMATFILAHVHDQAECQVAYAAWRGYDSPLRGLDAMASCANGDHRIYWTVDADNASDALKQLPPYLAVRTHASEVRRVAIR